MQVKKKACHIHQYNIKRIVWVDMICYLSFKPFTKLISLSITLVSLSRSNSLTNVATPCHDKLPSLYCLHYSIHTFIQSILFVTYKCIASHSRPTILK